jgi:hypothetical protein
MKAPLTYSLFLSQCYRAVPVRNRVAILACSLYLLVLLAIVALCGCARTEGGLAREQRMYQAGTNFLGGLQAVTPYLPAPVQLPVEAIAGAIAAALAAWNLHQQKQIKALRNGNGNGNGNGQDLALKAKLPTREL